MNILRQLLLWIATLLVPVALSLLAVWIVLQPWYINLEYHTPNFPEDPFGFTLQDRLLYAHIARDYLLNDKDISFLGDLRFPEGEQAPPVSCQFMDDCTRLYNVRELEHMHDVKNVVRGALRVLVGAVALLGILGILAGWQKWGRDYLGAVGRGGWLTLPLMAVILLFVLAAFGVIFVFFHEVFFAEGTWTFYTSDTLIRLFPERFWRDTFLMVGGLTGVMGIAIALISKNITYLIARL